MRRTAHGFVHPLTEQAPRLHPIAVEVLKRRERPARPQRVFDAIEDPGGVVHRQTRKRQTGNDVIERGHLPILDQPFEIDG